MNVPIELVIIGQQQVELTQLKMELAALKEKIDALMLRPEAKDALAP